MARPPRYTVVRAACRSPGNLVIVVLPAYRAGKSTCTRCESTSRWRRPPDPRASGLPPPWHIVDSATVTWAEFSYSSAYLVRNARTWRRVTYRIEGGAGMTH